VSVTVHAGRSRYPRWPSAAGFADGYWADFMARFADGVFDPRITHTRASTATYIDRDGYLRTAAANAPRITYDPATLECRGYLHEAAATNLLTYSQDFSNSDWTNSNLTVSTNAALAPDGTITAANLIENTVPTQTHSLTDGFVKAASAITYTMSAFVKPAFGSRRLVLVFADGIGNGAYTIIDLANAVIGVSATLYGVDWANASARISAAANGFYRVQLTATSSTDGLVICSYRLDNDTGSNPLSQTYTGDGTSGVYLWGAQLEANPRATSYIPTAGSSVVRSADIAYIDVATHLAGLSQTDFTVYCEAQQFVWNGSQRIIGTNAAGSRNIIEAGSGQSNIGNWDGGAYFTVTGEDYSVAPRKMAASFRAGARTLALTGTSADSASNSMAAFTQLHVGSNNAGADPVSAAVYKSLKVWKRGFSAAETEALTE